MVFENSTVYTFFKTNIINQVIVTSSFEGPSWVGTFVADDGNKSSFWNIVFGITEDNGQCPK